MREYLNKYKNNIVFALMASYALILPIPKITTIREILFFVIFILTFIDFFTNKSKAKVNLKYIKIWFLYLSISIFSLFYAIDFSYSLEEIRKEIIYTIILIFITFYWIKKERDFLNLLKILILGNLILTTVSIVQVFSFLINNLDITPQISPLKMGVGNFSTYIILCVPLLISVAIYYSKKDLKISFLLIILLISNIICLYFTSNRMGWFSLLVEIIIMLFFMYKYNFLKYNKKIFILVSISVLIVLIIALIKILERADAKMIQNNSNPFQQLAEKINKSISKDPRYPIWKVAISNIIEKPFTGGGFGRETFKLINPEFSKKYPFGWHAHNMFLNKGVQMGIPGIVVFSLIFVFLIKIFIGLCNHLKNKKQILIFPIAGIVATFGVITKNLTDDFFVRDQSWLFWLIISAIISSVDSKQNNGGYD